MPEEEITELDARAVRATIPLVNQVTAADLGRPTPCGNWNLGELIAHMTAQHHGFAASAHGGATGLADWQPGPPAADPVKAYAASAEEVLAAFAEDGAAKRRFALPEILPSITFPGRQAISFHLVDYVVHGWDVARSLGVDYTLDDALLAAARRVATMVPDGDNRTQPNAAFAPALAPPPGASELDQIVATLGRAPTWPN
ncbi:MAG: TIGR03086 family metal-binding protein [Streptosporangiaceae bacterium]